MFCWFYHNRDIRKNTLRTTEAILWKRITDINSVWPSFLIGEIKINTKRRLFFRGRNGIVVLVPCDQLLYVFVKLLFVVQAIGNHNGSLLFVRTAVKCEHKPKFSLPPQNRISYHIRIWIHITFISNFSAQRPSQMLYLF